MGSALTKRRHLCCSCRREQRWEIRGRPRTLLAAAHGSGRDEDAAQVLVSWLQAWIVIFLLFLLVLTNVPR